jgi:hypothetical protein
MLHTPVDVGQRRPLARLSLLLLLLLLLLLQVTLLLLLLFLLQVVFYEVTPRYHKVHTQGSQVSSHNTLLLLLLLLHATLRCRCCCCCCCCGSSSLFEGCYRHRGCPQHKVLVQLLNLLQKMLRQGLERGPCLSNAQVEVPDAHS